MVLLNLPLIQNNVQGGGEGSSLGANGKPLAYKGEYPLDPGLKTHYLFACALIFTLRSGVIRLQLYLASTTKVALANKTDHIPGGYSWEFLVGVCRPILQILTLFQIKKCHFLHRFSDLGRVSRKSR